MVKNKFLASLIAALSVICLASPAFAQVSIASGKTLTFVDGVQLSSSGSNLNVGGNVLATGIAPAPTGTGTPTIATGSTDTAGEVTAGSSATSVVITFAAAKTNAPFCVVRSQAQITSFAYTISTTAITITQTATSGNLIDYICVQH